MVSAIQNMCNYFKYGKIVHKSSNGNVIRKKVINHESVSSRRGHVSTTKTILNKDGKVQKQIQRKSYRDEYILMTSVRPINYNPETGLVKDINPRTKEYFVDSVSKRIYDYNKPGYDYKMTPLADGTCKYEIAFPEVTVIEDGKVRTSIKSKTYIK